MWKGSGWPRLLSIGVLQPLLVVKALAERFQVAEMLDEGFTYAEMAQDTGASTATISRGKRFVNYGVDCYRLVLEKLRRERVVPPESNP